MKKSILFMVIAGACISLSTAATANSLAMQSDLKVNEDTSSAQFASSRWATELSGPVMKLLAAEDGSTYAIVHDKTHDRIEVVGINAAGEVMANSAYIELDGGKAFLNSPIASPQLHHDGMIYLPVDRGTPTVATLYQIDPKQNFSTRIVFQKSDPAKKQDKSLHSYQIADDHYLYVGVREHDMVKMGSLCLLDMTQADPENCLWQKSLNSPPNKLVLSPDGKNVAVFDSLAEHTSYSDSAIYDRQGQKVADIPYGHWLQTPSVAVDNQGAVYGAMLSSSALYKMQIFDKQDNSEKIWRADSSQERASLGNRWITTGAQGNVYMKFFNKLYAFNGQTGTSLFKLTAPDYKETLLVEEANRFLGYGGVATDPATGWGYTSYVQVTPPRVGVLGISPDGSEKRSIIKIDGDFTAEKSQATPDINVNMSEPAIKNNTMYVSIGNTVYATPLSAPVTIIGLNDEYHRDDKGKLSLTFAVKTAEASAVTARLYCEDLLKERCSRPTLIASALTQPDKPSNITLDNLDGMPVKAGQYILNLTAITQDRKETRNDVKLIIN